MNAAAALIGYLDYQRGVGLSEATIRRSHYLVGRFLRWLRPRDLRETTLQTLFAYREHLAGLPAQRGGPRAASSVAVEMVTLKGFFQYLLRYGLLLANPAEDLEVGKRRSARPRAIFSVEEIGAFLDGIEPVGPEGQRDRALFELLYSSALRAREILALQLEQVDLAQRVLLVACGKGNKDRYVPFADAAARFLRLYISDGRKSQLARAVDRRALFLGGGRGGRLSYRRLTHRFHRHLDACGLAGRGFTLHAIRHATATHLLAAGASIRYVQELLGHESVETTQVYTRPELENIKAVYRSYHPRENEYYRELDAEYLAAVEALRRRLLWGRETAALYRKAGHLRGRGRFRHG